MRTTLVAALLLLAWPASSQAGTPNDWMLRLTLAGQQIEGTPLRWNAARVHFLARDGRLWDFRPEEVTAFQKTADRFQPYSVSELRAALLREMGDRYEVSGTGHYLVVHPRDQRDRWAERFEDLYRSFFHYFSVRGLSPSPPRFPLIGIVCRDQRDFQRYAAAHGTPASPGVLGCYGVESNRIVLVDLGGDSLWQRSAAVIIHEATHQTAFNTGIHSRFAPPPLWVAEGLATMFEAPGVHDSRRWPRQADRINREQFRQFQSLARRHRPELLASLVASDDVFRASPAAAYAEAWALTFFLAETEPRKYARYLALTAARPPFSSYTAAERTADFTAVFGSDWRMLEARLLRFMAGLGEGT
jgi:hypothetical protein